MFTVQLTNHQFGYTSYYGSFADMASARMAVSLIRTHSNLHASFDAVAVPDGVIPRPLHVNWLMRRPS